MGEMEEISLKEWDDIVKREKKMTKYCIDCKWAGNREDPDFLYCDAPGNKEISIVTGRESRRYGFCATHRNNDWLACRVLGTCGREGRWYEPGSS